MERKPVLICVSGILSEVKSVYALQVFDHIETSDSGERINYPLIPNAAFNLLVPVVQRAVNRALEVVGFLIENIVIRDSDSMEVFFNEFSTEYDIDAIVRKIEMYAYKCCRECLPDCYMNEKRWQHWSVSEYFLDELRMMITPRPSSGLN